MQENSKRFAGFRRDAVDTGAQSPNVDRVIIGGCKNVGRIKSDRID